MKISDLVNDLLGIQMAWGDLEIGRLYDNRDGSWATLPEPVYVKNREFIAPIVVEFNGNLFVSVAPETMDYDYQKH